MRSIRSRLIVVVSAIALVCVVGTALVVARTTSTSIADAAARQRIAEEVIVAELSDASMVAESWSDMSGLVAALAMGYDARIVITDLEGEELVAVGAGRRPPLIGVLDPTGPVSMVGMDGRVDLPPGGISEEDMGSCLDAGGVGDDSPIDEVPGPYDLGSPDCLEIIDGVGEGGASGGLVEPALLHVGFVSTPDVPWALVVLIAVVAGAVATILAVGVSGYIDRPIGDLVRATRQIREGRLDVRVEESKVGEIAELGDSFNEMVETLAAAATQRRQLTSDVAHELRSPVTNIVSHLDAIEDGVIDPSDESYSVVLAEAVRLSTLIDDLQMLSSLDEGTLPLHRTPTNVREVVEAAVLARLGRAEAGGVSVVLVDGPESDAVIDRLRIGQVCGNLLDNAIEHTPPAGSVAVTVTPSDDAVCIRVADSGPGIPPEILPHVFDRLRRGDHARTPGVGGRGLGLAISRGIVQAHGGRITVDNLVDGGAAFSVILPVG